MPEELIRCWETEYIDNDGKKKNKKVSLMYRRDVPQYRTPFLMAALGIFVNWRLFNKEPPCGQGWANERNVTVQILRIMESEDNQYDAWERDLEDAKHKKP